MYRYIKDVPTDKEYKEALNRWLDGESVGGDRDKVASILKFYFRGKASRRENLRRWYKAKRKKARSAA